MSSTNFNNHFISFFFFLFKKGTLYQPSDKVDPYVVYKEGLEAFENNDFFYAEKNFQEAEINFVNPELAAKSAIMSASLFME